MPIARLKVEIIQRPEGVLVRTVQKVRYLDVGLGAWLEAHLVLAVGSLAEAEELCREPEPPPDPLLEYARRLSPAPEAGILDMRNSLSRNVVDALVGAGGAGGKIGQESPASVAETGLKGAVAPPVGAGKGGDISSAQAHTTHAHAHAPTPTYPRQPLPDPHDFSSDPLDFTSPHVAREQNPFLAELSELAAAPPATEEEEATPPVTVEDLKNALRVLYKTGDLKPFHALSPADVVRLAREIPITKEIVDRIWAALYQQMSVRQEGYQMPPLIIELYNQVQKLDEHNGIVRKMVADQKRR